MEVLAQRHVAKTDANAEPGEAVHEAHVPRLLSTSGVWSKRLWSLGFEGVGSFRSQGVPETTGRVDACTAIRTSAQAKIKALTEASTSSSWLLVGSTSILHMHLDMGQDISQEATAPPLKTMSPRLLLAEACNCVFYHGSTSCSTCRAQRKIAF